MTRLEFLEKCLKDEKAYLLAFSENYLMSKPGKGYESEYFECREKVEFLETWIKEMEGGD